MSAELVDTARDASGDATSTPMGRLLAAASALASAASGVIEYARAEDVFRQEVAGYAADPNHIHPLGEELDQIADALANLHIAIGEPNSTSRFYDAADRWVQGED